MKKNLPSVEEARIQIATRMTGVPVDGVPENAVTLRLQQEEDFPPENVIIAKRRTVAG